MDTQDECEFTQGRLDRRMPLDVQIIAWIIVASAIISIFSIVLLLCGLIRFPSGYSRPILFGLTSLDSNLSSGIYSSVTAALDLICAYGLIRGQAYAWWLVLILYLCGLADTLLIYFEAPITATLSLCMTVAIIVWLVYRRRLYGIGDGLKST